MRGALDDLLPLRRPPGHVSRPSRRSSASSYRLGLPYARASRTHEAPLRCVLRSTATGCWQTSHDLLMRCLLTPRPCAAEQGDECFDVGEVETNGRPRPGAEPVRPGLTTGRRSGARCAPRRRGTRRRTSDRSRPGWWLVLVNESRRDLSLRRRGHEASSYGTSARETTVTGDSPELSSAAPAADREHRNRGQTRQGRTCGPGRAGQAARAGEVGMQDGCPVGGQRSTPDTGSRGGRYWVRTSDLFGVNEARYHCANRPRAPRGGRHHTRPRTCSAFSARP